MSSLQPCIADIACIAQLTVVSVGWTDAGPWHGVVTPPPSPPIFAGRWDRPSFPDTLVGLVP